MGTSIFFPAIAAGTVIGAVAGGLMGAVLGSTTKSEYFLEPILGH
jgi:Na+/citrate or Na+/malate symporter